MSNCTKNAGDILKNEKNMGIWIFAEIFEIAKILQIYKGKVRMGHFKSAAILCSVHRFCSNFFWKLQKDKVGKVKKFEHMIAIEKKCAIANGRSCGSLRPPPRTHRVKKYSFYRKIIEEHQLSSIDLFHVNCEGCEWEMIENLLASDLVKKMR